MATIIIPTPLRKFTGNNAKVQVNGTSIDAAIKELVLNFPDIKKHLLDEKEQVRSFVNVFVGDDDIRDLQQADTQLAENSTVSIVPAIAGGKY